jgi:small subunit ribosomal protein S8e
MGVWQERSKRKPSGGKYRKYRDKKKFSMARYDIKLKIADAEKRKNIRVMGGNAKTKLVTGTFANVLDSKTKKIKKVKIKTVVENPSSRHYARMNVVTKGAILDTEVGTVRVTNSPGKEGMINAVLVEKKVEEPTKPTKKK